MTFPSYPTITRQLPPRQLASFPRTGLQGLLTAVWLWWLRRHLNRDRYRLTLRGRKAKTPRRFGQQSIPLAAARRVGVYIDDKMSGKLEEYRRAWGRHDAERTAEKREEGLRLTLQGNRELVETLRDQLKSAGFSNTRLQGDVATLATSRDDAERDFQTIKRQRDREKRVGWALLAGLNILDRQLILHRMNPEGIQDDLDRFVETAREAVKLADSPGGPGRLMEEKRTA